MTPYYQDDWVTLYHGRWEDVLPALGLFDLVFTSPPYNLGASPWPHLGNWKQGDSAGGKSKWRNGSDGAGGVTYESHDDTLPWPEYVAWQRAALTMFWDHLTPAGAIFYNHKPRVIGGTLWLPLELNPGLPLRQVVIWARAGGMNFNPTAYVPTHEWVMVIAKADWRLRSKAASGAGDVWRLSQEPNPDHPAPFPRWASRYQNATARSRRSVGNFDDPLPQHKARRVNEPLVLTDVIDPTARTRFAMADATQAIRVFGESMRRAGDAADRLGEALG